jgi:hypothetical protein
MHKWSLLLSQQGQVLVYSLPLSLLWAVGSGVFEGCMTAVVSVAAWQTRYATGRCAWIAVESRDTDESY